MSFLTSANKMPSIEKTIFNFGGVNYNPNRKDNEFSECKNIVTNNLPAVTVRGRMHRVTGFATEPFRILKYANTHDSVIEINNLGRRYSYGTEFMANGKQKDYWIDKEDVDFFMEDTIPIKYKNEIMYSYISGMNNDIILYVLAEDGGPVKRHVISKRLIYTRNSYITSFGNRILCACGNEIKICYEDDISVWNKYHVEGSTPGSSDPNEAACQQIPVTTGGNFTACTYYKDKAIIFKERAMYALYGTYTPFSLVKIADIGCISADSVKIMGDNLVFLSGDGVMAYAGGTPYCISDNLPQISSEQVKGCCADSRYYYINKYVYDSKFKCWSCIDEDYLPAFIAKGRTFFYYPKNQDLVEMREDWLSGGERVAWNFTTNVFYEDDATEKIYMGVSIRIEPLEQSEVMIEISKNGGEFELYLSDVFLCGGGRTIPLKQKPCDNIQIRVSGIGRVRIPFIKREYRRVRDGL